MPKTSHFRIKYPWFFNVFSRPSPGPHFSWLFGNFVPKCLIFGPPWRPAGPKMAAKILQMTPKCSPKLSYAHTSVPIRLRNRFWRAPGYYLHCFGKDFKGNWQDFSIVLDSFGMQSATKHAYRPQKLKTLGAPFSQYFWRGAAQRRNFSGQVPTTPLGAPSSQDFGGPRIMKQIQEPPRTDKNQKVTNADNQTPNFESVSTQRCQ